MRLGFSFRQTLSGSYWLLEAPVDERAIAFTMDARAADVRGFVRHKTWRITGTIDAERMASARPLEGTVVFGLLEERRISYRFAFSGEDGNRYELTGQEEWNGFSPIESLTLLPASLYDDHGEEIARGILRFDLKADWATWVRSFRLQWEW
jgi:hypothetical protein